MRKTIVALMFLLISFVLELARAEEKIHFQVGDSTYYLTKYPEGESVFVDVFKVDASGFQMREFHFDFLTELEAEEKFLALQNKYKNLKVKKSESNTAKPYAKFSLWVVTQDWNEDWEDRYSAWMKENLTTGFLYDHQIATDCADVPVTYRWVFAMLNGLPAGNILAGSRVLFTQDSAPATWQQLPTHENWWQNQMFLKSIEYLQDNTYTASVFYDLHPVRIDARAVAPGTVWVINSYHAYNVGQIDFDAQSWMKMYSSTVPREMRRLSVRSFDFTRPVFDESGFQRHRWIKKVNNKWVMVRGEDMPWYSLEQYAENFAPDAGLFAPIVYQKLSGQPVDPDVWLQGLINNLDRTVYDRKYIVEDGFYECFPDRCPVGSDLYEAHSTPSRDRRILETIIKIEDFIKSNPDQGLQEQWDYALKYWYYTIYHSDGNSSFYLALKDVVSIWKQGKYSYDPNHLVEVRWGVAEDLFPTELERNTIEQPNDYQSEVELKEAADKIAADFRGALFPDQLSVLVKQRAASKYNYLDPENLVPDVLLEQALLFFDANKDRFRNTNYMTVVDLGLRSDNYRFFVIDMATGRVEPYHTSHGEGSDLEDDGRAEAFSNIVDSYMSSLGFIRTGEVYSGSFGRSMRLDGLSETNSNIRRRAIVFHGSDHVFEQNIIQGLSKGCLAFDWMVKDGIIDKIQNGSLIYVGVSN